MQTIRVDAHVDQDGILRLELPTAFSDADVKVIVTVQHKEKRSWPVGYFEQTAGSFAEDPLERPSQGHYEEREKLL